MYCLLASFVSSACGLIPEKKVEISPEVTVEKTESTRDAADAKRIDDLEQQLSERQRQLIERQRQLTEKQRQLTERQRQLTEQQRQFNEEKQRLERELRESQSHSDELQKKLDAILAIDRDLRRGGKGTE